MFKKVRAIFRKKRRRRFLVLSLIFLAVCVGVTYLRGLWQTCAFCGSTRSCRGWTMKYKRVHYKAPRFAFCQHQWQPGISPAVEKLVRDGDIVLLKQGEVYGAFILHDQQPTSTQIEYDWYYRTDGNGTFGSEDSDFFYAGKGVPDRIRFGPFVIGYSQASAGKGFIYYSRFPGGRVRPDDLHICVTEERDIEQIDATDSRWLYKGSATHKESAPGPPESFRHLYEVLQGQNLGLHLKPMGEGLFSGLTEGNIEGPDKEALVGLLRAQVAEALDSSSLELPRGQRGTIAERPFPLAMLKITSSNGKCDADVYANSEVSPELVRGTTIQWYRIPCPGIWKILEEAEPKETAAPT